MRWDYLKFQQGEDAMPPSYSVRRGRPTPQLCMLLKIFYLIYSLFTNSASRVRTLPYSIPLWSYTLAIGSWRCSNESNTRQQQALAYHPEPPHKPSHKLSAPQRPLRSLRPFPPRTFSHHTRTCTKKRGDMPRVFCILSIALN